MITEADWRLFPTLVRFDAVYYSHFKCNERRLVDYPHLWAYTRDLYQQPGIAGTVAMDQIKRHYYTTHDFLNPSRIIPAGPLDRLRGAERQGPAEGRHHPARRVAVCRTVRIGLGRPQPVSSPWTRIMKSLRLAAYSGEPSMRT